MEEKSHNWSGMMSNLGDAIGGVFREFGTPLIDALAPALQGLVDTAGGLADTARAWGQVLADGIGTVQNLIAQGTLGEALMLTLKIGLAEASNYGIALFSGLAETAGLLLGAAMKEVIALAESMTKADFWAGMLNAFQSIALQFVALLERLSMSLRRPAST